MPCFSPSRDTFADQEGAAIRAGVCRSVSIVVSWFGLGHGCDPRHLQSAPKVAGVRILVRVLGQEKP